MADVTSNTVTTPSSPEGSFLGGKGRLVLVGVVLVLAIVYLIYAAFPGNTSYYFTVDELSSFDGVIDGRTIRVKGKLVPDSFAREEGTTSATFQLTAGGQVLPAIYNGVVPDLFFNSHSDIIIQGSYNGLETFDVETVSVLCPTKYEPLVESDV